MSKRNPTIHNIRAGQTLYAVIALGQQSYIEVIKPTGKVRKYVDPDSPLNGSYVFPTGGSPWDKEWCSDIGISEQRALSYNDHRTFFSRRKAESYLKLCLEEVVPGYPNEPEWDEWGWSGVY